MIIDPYVWYKTPILALAHVADDTVAVTVAKPDDYTFVPGQYALLQISFSDTEKYIRQYSFSSSPAEDRLEFLIRRQPGGKVSSWLHDIATIGTLISITKPYGRFEKSATASHHVFVAGGVGLAPFLSMLRDDSSHCSLVYSERHAGRVGFDKELTHLLGDNYHAVFTSKSERINATNFSQLCGQDYHYYVCGSKQFVDEIENHLIATIGVARENIVREAFTLQ